MALFCLNEKCINWLIIRLLSSTRLSWVRRLHLLYTIAWVFYLQRSIDATILQELRTWKNIIKNFACTTFCRMMAYLHMIRNKVYDCLTSSIQLHTILACTGLIATISLCIFIGNRRIPKTLPVNCSDVS